MNLYQYINTKHGFKLDTSSLHLRTYREKVNNYSFRYSYGLIDIKDQTVYLDDGKQYTPEYMHKNYKVWSNE